jgi:WD40 repeat protein
MRLFRVALAILLFSGMAALTPADEPAGKDKESKKVSAEEIDRLVTQLGDDDFNKRGDARKQLVAIGEPAIAALKKAIENSSDAEIRSTATRIVEDFERKASGVVRIFAGHGNRVNGVTITPDGKRAISVSWDGMIRFWNAESGDLIRQLHGHNGSVNGVAISPDGKKALTGGVDQTMRLWDLETGQQIRLFAGHTNTVWDVAFSPDGTKALSGCSDGNVRLWEVESGKLLQTLEAHKGGRAWTVAFTPDGKQAVTGGGNQFDAGEEKSGSLRLWDLAAGKEIRRFEGHAKDIRRVAIAPDGKLLLSGSFDGTMRLWDMQTGKEIKRFNGPGNFVESVGFTADGKRAVCSYGPKVVDAVYDEDPRCSLRLWDIETGKELRQFKGHGGPVLTLALSGDGRFLVSGSADCTMRLWEMPK